MPPAAPTLFLCLISTVAVSGLLIRQSQQGLCYSIYTYRIVSVSVTASQFSRSHRQERHQAKSDSQERMHNIPQHILLSDLLQRTIDTHLVIMLWPENLLPFPLQTNGITAQSELPCPIKDSKRESIRSQQTTRHRAQHKNRRLAIPLEDLDHCHHLKQRTDRMQGMMHTMHPPLGSCEIDTRDNASIRTLGQKNNHHPDQDQIQNYIHTHQFSSKER